MQAYVSRSLREIQNEIDKLFIYRFDEMDKRWDGRFELKLGRLETKFDARLGRLEASLEARLEATLETKLEAKLDPIRNDLGAIKDAVRIVLARLPKGRVGDAFGPES